MRSVDELIIDYLSGAHLSEEESGYLHTWLQEHENRKFLLHIDKMEDKEAYLRMFGSQEAYDAVEARVLRYRKRKRAGRIAVYSGLSMAASVLLVIGLFFFLRPGVSESQLAERMIKPGVSRAELKLADGRIVQLDAREDLLIISDSTLNIKSTDKMLVYSASDPDREQEYNVLMVPAGAEYNLLLSDGTKVYLNSGSELRYPVVFFGEQRRVYLTGEAYFEVAGDPARPFIVQTDPFTIRVTGTAFNVRAYPGQEMAATTLEEGEVEVVCGNKAYSLLPGMQIAYDKEADTVTCRQVDTELYTSWKEGYYSFQNMPLGEIINTLALWYDLTVFYETPAVKELVFGGRLKRYDNVTYLLEKFEETNEVEFLIKGNSITVRKK